MENNTTTKQVCTLDNVEYWEDVTAVWTVDEQGFPDVYSDSTNSGDFRCYYCDSCQKEFDSWEDVEEHLNEG